MKPHRLLALIALPLMAATAAPAQNVTVTGNNGGTLAKSRDCARSSGSATCATSSTLTSPAGETANWGRERNRTTGNGQSETSISRTGPGGETSGRTRLITR